MTTELRWHHPNVAAIAPGAPFLPVLVDTLLSGELIPGFAPGNDAFALPSATIWVPTRRAARALEAEFVARFDGEAALLPKIYALGDAVDDDDINGDFHPDSALQPTVSAMERHLVLTRLVDAWSKTLNPKQRDLYQGEDIVMPSSTADAVRFAGELSRLMDSVVTEGADWSKLKDLAPEDYSQWWQLTLQFLHIASEQWPAWLSERGLQDATALRVAALKRAAASYRDAMAAGRPSGPVVAAGSTGSIPATADLLKTVANLPGGALVLPGLDRDSDEQVWVQFDLPDNEKNDGGVAHAHPQFGLKRLLTHLNVAREEVRWLGDKSEQSLGAKRTRELLINEALKPSAATGQWRQSFEKVDPKRRLAALDKVALCEARNEREEALAIALALRETLETPKSVAALVTPDRNLARRVAAEMRRFGIDVDDSAGQPLRNRPHGSFARLALELAVNGFDVTALASFVKHPLCRFGADVSRARHAARILELALLRGGVSALQPDMLVSALSAVREALEDPKTRTHSSLKRLSSSDWDDAIWLARELTAAFCDTGMSGEAPLSLAALARASVALIETAGRDDNGGLTALYSGPAGTALRDLFGDLIERGALVSVVPADWPAVFDALLDGRAVRPIAGTHPRVAILGPIEARLQTFDRVVLGGLNEGTWPAATRNDPFLSRPMKLAFGLPAPERRTGLAAHDFQMLLGMTDVVITRALRVENAPAVASRWVQRLNMIAGEEAEKAMRARGQRYLDWAGQIDATANPPNTIEQPKPRPPVDTRPTSLSITEIETWIRDPYAIYARHILKLDALPPLIRSPDVRERGTLYHAIMETFVRKTAADPRLATTETLLEIASEAFARAAIPGDLQVQWWPRFVSAAMSFLDWHREAMADAKSVHVEMSGATGEGLDGFTLRGIADRIDVLGDDRLSIIDYKTGANPSKAQVLTLVAPQLPLEAAMAARGAFGKTLVAPTAALSYVRLRPGSKFKVDTIDDAQHDSGGNLKSVSAADLAEMAWEELAALVHAYRDVSTPYVSKARPLEQELYPGDYDHLARVREWAVVSGEAEE